MGQSVNTSALLLPFHKDWYSKWYSYKHYSLILHKDLLIGKFIENVFKKIGLFNSKYVIKRTTDKVYIYVNVYTKMNIKEKTLSSIINTRQIKQLVTSLTKLLESKVILVIRPTDIYDSHLLAQYVSNKLEMRMSFQTVFNKIISKIKRYNQILEKEKRAGVIKGIRIQCSGRPTGNDMANIQWFKYGQIPLHTY